MEIHDSLLTEHIKYNIQFCPHCLKDKDTLNYNVIFSKKIKESVDLWKCRLCKKQFRLPNKYFLALNQKNTQLYKKAIEDSIPKKSPTSLDRYV